MAVYDVNGDGLNDVVTSLQAHGLGLSWFEQKKAADGTRSVVEHPIMTDFSTKNAGGVIFSQLHGATYRHVFDLADWDKGMATSAPGQSGQYGSPHYADQVTAWSEQRLYPMLYSWDRVEADAAGGVAPTAPKPAGHYLDQATRRLARLDVRLARVLLGPGRAEQLAERLNLLGTPAGILHRPGVVIGAMAPECRGPIVRGAPPDDPRDPAAGRARGRIGH